MFMIRPEIRSNAEDVAWSYNTYLATGNATQFAKYLDSAEATDATHVVFHMKEDKCKRDICSKICIEWMCRLR